MYLHLDFPLQLVSSDVIKQQNVYNNTYF